MVLVICGLDELEDCGSVLHKQALYERQISPNGQQIKICLHTLLGRLQPGDNASIGLENGLAKLGIVIERFVVLLLR